MLLSGLAPFSLKNPRQTTAGTFFKMEGVGWSNISAAAKDLVALLLERSPERRPSAEEALKHPWLQEVEDLEVTELLEEQHGAHQTPTGQDLAYFARLTHLVQCQQLKTFFNKTNIKEVRTTRLVLELPL